MSRLAALEAERDRALPARRTATRNTTKAQSSGMASAGEVGSQLLRLWSIGLEIASVLSLEAFYRNFNNRREVAAYSGLASSPWKSDGIDVEQGIPLRRDWSADPAFSPVCL